MYFKVQQIERMQQNFALSFFLIGLEIVVLVTLFQ